MMDEEPEKFSKKVVGTLAKRAANKCSNPDCGAITAGPAKENDRSINVGEAAHIYGARPRSARYDEEMTPAERSDITNAIWLCRNCHKIVDNNPAEYPAALLFEWRREHEGQISKHLGKTGVELRQKVIARSLEGFENVSYLAQQIIIDKPEAWEYRLVTELLRSKLHPILKRWDALEKGLYVRPFSRISEEEASSWFKDTMDEIAALVPALARIITEEIPQAWGPPGVPGSETEILRVCDLFIEACQSILDWEERVRFSRLPSEFQEVQELLYGVGALQINAVKIVPDELAKPFNQENPSGVYTITVTFELPEGWADQVERAFKRIEARASKQGLWS